MTYLWEFTSLQLLMFDGTFEPEAAKVARAGKVETVARVTVEIVVS